MQFASESKFGSQDEKYLEMRDKPPKIAYHYNGTLLFTVECIGYAHFAEDHPMRPERLALTHSLLNSFNLLPSLYYYVRRLESLEIGTTQR